MGNRRYDIEIAADSNFTSIIESSTVATNAYKQKNLGLAETQNISGGTSKMSVEK
jgi:hypothetical protein